MITGFLIIFPLLIGLIIFIVKNERWVKILAVTGSTTEFLISVYGLFLYTTKCNCQLLLYLGSIGNSGISIRLGMDGISLVLVLLTTFLIPLVILSGIHKKPHRSSALYGSIMLIETGAICVFSVNDVMLFVFFFELSLILAYLLFYFEENSGRTRLTFNWFLQIFSGSLLLFAGLIYLFYRTPLPHSFDLYSLRATILTLKEQSWLFLGFFVAFIVQTPVFQLNNGPRFKDFLSHSMGSVIMTGILMKIGLYGFLRFLFPICSLLLKERAFIILILALLGIIIINITAIRQKDWFAMAVYFFIANLALISAGMFTLTESGLNGAAIQLISNGINITGLFMIRDLIQIRLKTTDISKMGRIAIKAPWLGVFFLIFLFGTIAFPFTNGFIGEFLIVLGVFEYNHWIALAFGITIIFCAVFLLRMFQRIMLRETTEMTNDIHDLTWYEALPMIPLVIVVLGMGIFPGLILQLIDPAAKEILYFIHS